MEFHDDFRKIGKSLATQCIVVLVLIGAMSTAACLLLSSILATKESDAPQVNIAGRQRMLSQRVCLYAHRLVATQQARERDDIRSTLESAIDLMETSHFALLHGDASMGVSADLDANLEDHYFGDSGLDSRVRGFIHASRRLLNEPEDQLVLENPHLQKITEAASKRLLVELDAAVMLYEQNSNARTSLLRHAELVIWGCTLVLLGGVWTWVFRPMVERIQFHLEDRRKANAELIDKDRRIQLLLDSTGDGLLPIDLDGRVQSGASSRVSMWFGEVGLGKPFWDVISNDEDEKLSIELGFEQIVSDFLPFDVAVAQAVSRVTRGDQVLGIDYRELFDEGERTGFLLVIRDITSDLAREKSEADTREFGKILSNAIRDQHSFSRFVTETRISLAQAASSETTEAVAARLLHTIKGNTSIFGFQQFSRQVHAAEESLLSGETLSHIMPSLQEDWNRRAEQFQEIISCREDVWISQYEHERHIDHLTRAGCCAGLVPAIRRWSFESARRNMEQLAKGARRLAGRLNKEVKVKLVVDDALRLDAENFGGIWTALIHVVRNSLDHGIETPEQRVANGKPPAGNLEFRCRIEGDSVKITVADDGCGVDWERIRDKAADMGLPVDCKESLVEALFSDGLSSRDHASEISGRGVGMSALKEMVELKGGIVAITSERGSGTEVMLSIPLPNDNAYIDLRDSRPSELKART